MLGFSAIGISAVATVPGSGGSGNVWSLSTSLGVSVADGYLIIGGTSGHFVYLSTTLDTAAVDTTLVRLVVAVSESLGASASSNGGSIIPVLIELVRLMQEQLSVPAVTGETFTQGRY